jgi:CheY-like chemotaxis protein
MVRRGSREVPTVLLVESPQDDREMYAEYLRLHGFHPVEIADSARALAEARSADVVVTGIRVPGPFDGLELVRRLRTAARLKKKPVIVLTACALEQDRQQALAAGCDAFLTKPCLPEALAAEIRRALAARAPRRTARARANRRHRDVA